MKSTFETIWLFFHRPVGLVELLILYARVQFYTPRASDYRLISKTVNNWNIVESGIKHHNSNQPNPKLLLLAKKTAGFKGLHPTPPSSV